MSAADEHSGVVSARWRIRRFWPYQLLVACGPAADPPPQSARCVAKPIQVVHRDGTLVIHTPTTGDTNLGDRTGTRRPFLLP
jgi:hypothetical protein